MDEGIDSPHDGDSTYCGITGPRQNLEVRLDAGVDPGIDDGFTIRVAMRRTNANINMRVRLLEATTQIKSQLVACTASYVTTNIVLTSGEASAISDFTNLRIEFRSPNLMMPGNQGRVTACQLELPNPTRLTRAGSQVASIVPTTIIPTRATRVGAQVGAEAVEEEMRLTRVGAQVAVEMPPFTRLTRVAAQVAVSTVYEHMFLTRVGVQVASLYVAPVKPVVRNTRVGIQVATSAPAAPTEWEVYPLDLPDDLPEFFLHNWATAVRLTTPWQTDVQSSMDTASEERVGLVTRPTRTVVARFSGLAPEQAAQIQVDLRRRSGERMPFPLYCDHSRITSDDSGALVACNTRYRRFFRGQRVAVVNWTSDRQLDSPQFSRIEEVLPAQLTLVDSVTRVEGGRVYPLIDAEVMLESSPLLHAEGGPVDVEVVAQEVAGRSALPGLGDSVTGFQTYNGSPVILLGANWEGGLEQGVVRPGERYAAGRTDVVEAKGDRARHSHSYPFVATTREDAWEAIRLFDVCRGRAGTMWLVPFSSTIRLSEFVSPNIVKVYKDQPLSWMESYVTTLGAVLTSGATTLAPVGSIADGGTTWDITLGRGMFPSAPSVIKRVEPACLVRFEKDALVENWVVDEVCEMKLQFLDLLNETVAEITDESA